MKKMIFCSLLLTVVLGLTGATNIWASEKAKVLFVQGSAMHQPPGDESRMLASGDVLPASTHIVTGPNSSVDLAIGDAVGSALKINANSRVNLTAADTVNIRVDQGKVMLIVKDLPAAGSVHIETPFAVSSVTSQGGFAVSADAVEVLEGAALQMQTNAGEMVTVEPGSGFRMATDGAANASYQVQNTSSYSDFKGQISDYRWAIPGTTEYAGVSEPSSVMAKDGIPVTGEVKTSDVKLQAPDAEANKTREEKVKEAELETEAEVAQEAADVTANSSVTVNLPPVPDQEAVI